MIRESAGLASRTKQIMARENLDEEAEQSGRPSDAPEPTHSETRARRDSLPPERGRPSIRPSAFGAPRPSQRPSESRPSERPPEPTGVSVAPIRESPAEARVELSLRTATPVASDGSSERPNSLHKSPDPATFSFRPPKAQRAESLPPPTPSREGPIAVPLETTALPPVPLAVSGEHPSLTPQSGRKTAGNPLFSMAAFVIMVAGAAIPLSRYLGLFERPAQEASARARPVALPLLKARSPEPVPFAPPKTQAKVQSPVQTGATLAEKVRAERLATLEANLPDDPEKQTEALLSAADKSVESGDLTLAETLLGRALKLGDRNPHVTFALARLRLRQGNLEGAEGWAVKAVRLRPRRAEYLVFYGELLRRLGREDEAERALHKARELERDGR